MRITHIVRADEHVSNTLRQVLVAEALGAAPPVFAHCALILDGETRQKLSKRSKSLKATVAALRSDGTTPLGLANYLASLGWTAPATGYGEKRQEIFPSLDDLAKAFDVGRISTAAAAVDAARLKWYDSQCVSLVEPSEWRAILADQLRRHLDADANAEMADDFVDLASRLMGDELKSSASEVVAAVQDTLEYADPQLPTCPRALAIVRLVAEDAELSEATVLDQSSWDLWTKGLGDRAGCKSKKDLFMPLRLALTATLRGPDVRQQLALGIFARWSGIGTVCLGDRIARLKLLLAQHDAAETPPT
mmetsp:Transcript_7540/g.26386  ORF Transcript_7540/g.26386 Transcript_7540/m.26386 type:complete len:306 (-) Transcript_7540:25-942(-)